MKNSLEGSTAFDLKEESMNIETDHSGLSPKK